MKISFSALGKYGRLGNQLFQVASTLGLAEKYNAEAAFPNWDYEQYFIDPLPHGEMATKQVKEKHFHFYDWELTESCDLLGYLQSEKYFPKKNPLVFKPELLESVKSKFNFWDKEIILIHIRRGDYVNCGNYFQLPITYFIKALLTHFTDYNEKNIVFISDEIYYAKTHFECLKNAYFVEGLSDIETIALGSMCDHFILSNSSFGWWIAKLGEKEHSKIIHPGHMFAGKLLENNTKDYWPDR